MKGLMISFTCHSGKYSFAVVANDAVELLKEASMMYASPVSLEVGDIENLSYVYTGRQLAYALACAIEEAAEKRFDSEA